MQRERGCRLLTAEKWFRVIPSLIQSYSVVIFRSEVEHISLKNSKLKGEAASFVKNQTGTFNDMSLPKSRFGYVCSRKIMRIRIQKKG